MSTPAPRVTTVDEAAEFVSRWRDDDHELAIPATPWGNELAYALDLLTGDKAPQHEDTFAREMFPGIFDSLNKLTIRPATKDA